VYKPAAVFHAVVSVVSAPASTKFEATWYYGDVGDPANNGKLLDTTTVTTDGTRNIDFTLRSDGSWPAGSYRVDISVNGTLDRSIEFSVAP